ncbi:PQQ-binding-like beta-propeller repeat protein [Amycolatopsis sp. NPDC098790]|uniref:outer membrane protein assembly factor BamB family protein n=1 Tax=Amycolatopsis sp. NPDC098790 TaxID=3363939 RepID=UPI003810E824
MTTSPFSLSGTGQVRWRVPLPGRHVVGVSAAADGMCFVTTETGVVALDGPEVRWTADGVGVPLGGGLLVTAGADGYEVRDQRTGAVTGAVRMTPRSAPMPLADGSLVFLAAGPVLRAVTLTGEPRWEAEVPAPAWPFVWHDTLFVAERAAVRAFDRDGAALWRAEPEGDIAGTLAGLPDGGVLVPVHGEEHTGYVVLDPGGGLRPVPAHLPPGDLVVPLPTGRLVLPGWPERDDVGEWRPTVSIVDGHTGAVVQHHRVPADVRGIAAGPEGPVAVACSPTWDRWTKYHGWPGFDLTEDCCVLFLDEDGPRGTWTAGRPITGPLAIAANGDLLVPVSGELVSLG